MTSINKGDIEPISDFNEPTSDTKIEQDEEMNADCLHLDIRITRDIKEEPIEQINTGFTINTVNKIYNNERVTNRTTSISLSGRIEIYKCLKDFYINKVPPTYCKLYESVKNVINIPTLDEFKENLTLMGIYNYHTDSGIEVLLEDPEVTFNRFFYLNKIKKVRETQGQTIYYIDERVIDSRLTFEKPWIEGIDDTSESWDGYILLNIISGKKYVNNLYCNRVNQEDFKKWLFDVVLKKMDHNSCIVMDNNKLHGKLINNKSLTKYDTKEDLLKWLNKNNIPCTSNMRKPELYQLYKKTLIRENEYDIDNILKAQGYDVLRLPSTLHDLSPAKLFWDHVRSSYISNNGITPISADRLYTVKSKLNSMVHSMKQEIWTKFEKEISDIENQLYDIDLVLEGVIDNFLKVK